MGRQEIVQHIESELHQDTEWDTESNGQPVLCQHCGVEILSSSPSAPHKQGDYVVHRVPAHGEAETRSIFYCGASCFNEAMSELFSAPVKEE